MNKYDKLSFRRKELQKHDLAPEWMSTASFQLITEKSYVDRGETPRDMYHRIATRAAELTTLGNVERWGYSSWYDAFFTIMWKGWLSPSTPPLTNMGNDRGHPIACSGTDLQDSIAGFYTARKEIAQLTQRGYGTSWCLDSVRPRGTPISKGGTANGPIQPASGAVQDCKEVSQGGTRRGSIGQYLNVLSPDFKEFADQIISDDDGWNIGWNMDERYTDLFRTDPKSADNIWKTMLKGRMVKGKGYQLYLDKVNRDRPQVYKDKGLFVKHSNLCSEIELFNDEDHSFTCVLSSMNISKWNEWKDTKTVQIATIFLDAVVEDMLIKARKEEGFERIVSFTEKSRAIGLGILGLSTYFQQESMIFGDYDSIMFNQKMMRHLDTESLKASKVLAQEVGEPEWMKGYGERFSHRLALPPTKSTAIIQGGISEGTMPIYANVFEQRTAGGIVYRINPTFLKLMKERGEYNEDVMRRIAESQGSVQGEDWLTDYEKKVFKTAFELNQETILLMASHRQRIMSAGGGGQGQSTNIYLQKETTEEYISKLHYIAWKDPHLHSLYYVHTLNEDSVHKVDTTICEGCEG